LASSFSHREVLPGSFFGCSTKGSWAGGGIGVFHDVLITLGFFSLLHFEISLTVIAALLTLVGYSMNDTIVHLRSHS